MKGSQNVKIELKGRIDSNNAAEVEKDLLEQLSAGAAEDVVIDAEELEYISSAGLRVILRIRKNYPTLKIINASSEVYEILEMTGFTEMMDVEKAYRRVSIEGCEEIGRGANGIVYRIDQDNVVKVYHDANGLEDIQHERELAKLALILGLPTAISYDVVKVGDSYGSVFELLNARSFSKILATEPDKLDWCVKEYVDMLKKIHSIEVPEGKPPDAREIALDWVDYVYPLFPEDKARKLKALVEEIPKDNHMIHGDYHTKNVELCNDEVLLIDMDTLSVGHPIIELACIFNAFIGYSEYDHNEIMDFQGFDHETAVKFFYRVMEEYLGTTCRTKIDEVVDKARVLGYTRMYRRSHRKNLLETEEGRAEAEMWKSELFELLDRTDTLLYSVNELDIEALPENLGEVQLFVEEKLEKTDCSPKAMMQINVAVEEIFINIASYAYAPDKGRATVRVEVAGDPVTVTITFIDHGIPYDPLSRQDPGVTKPAEDREIGGLGIFLTRKIMDDLSYDYADGKNILTLKKNLQESE